MAMNLLMKAFSGQGRRSITQSLPFRLTLHVDYRWKPGDDTLHYCESMAENYAGVLDTFVGTTLLSIS